MIFIFADIPQFLPLKKSAEQTKCGLLFPTFFGNYIDISTQNSYSKVACFPWEAYSGKQAIFYILI